MPGNLRHTLKRELERASESMDWTCKHLLMVQQAMIEYHPDIAEQIQAILESVVMMQDVIQALNKTI